MAGTMESCSPRVTAPPFCGSSGRSCRARAPEDFLPSLLRLAQLDRVDRQARACGLRWLRGLDEFMLKALHRRC
jgi:hypothetical protein